MVDARTGRRLDEPDFIFDEGPAADAIVRRRYAYARRHLGADRGPGDNGRDL